MNDQNGEVRFRASLAGRGDPWPALTRDRLGLLCRLQDGATIPDILADGSLALDQQEIDTAVSELRHFNLLAETKHGPRPTFLVVSCAETRRVVAAASATGRRLAERIADHWQSLERGFRGLPISRSYSLRDLSFFLVGARMLDMDLLTLLVQDGTLFTPAPSRPSPEFPDARYFLFAIEGTVPDMGAYGLDSQRLPWQSWEIGTFARSIIGGEANPRREAFDSESRAALEGRTAATPQELASQLGIPCLDRVAMTAWDALQSDLLRELFDVHEDEASAIRELSGTRATHRLPPVLGEFACWYDHVAYAAAITALIDADMIVPPKGECIAAVWYRLNPCEGVLLE